MSETTKKPTDVTSKAKFVGAVLILVNCYWLIEMELIHYSGHSTLYSLFFNVIFSVFILLLLNLPLKKLLPQIALRRADLLAIYVMLSISSAIAGHSMMQVLVPILGHSSWGATAENEWQELFGQHIPKWLVVDNKRALKGYYEGSSTLWKTENLLSWITPILAWSSFICVLVFMLLCVNVILRKQWIENEKLAYPIIQLPLELTTEHFSLFRNKLLWIGFALAGSYDLINGIHILFPAIPSLRFRTFDIGGLFTERPWNAIGYMPISLRPFLVGLAFFIPLDLSFSCWFFFLIWKSQLVIENVMGIQSRPEFPEQSVGAYIGLSLVALWATKQHFRQILTSELFAKKDGKNKVRQSSNDEFHEPISYKSALLGIIFSWLFIILFCAKAGMSVWAIITFFLLYIMTEIAITRMRAELGSPIHDLHFAGPEVLMIDGLGTRRLGKSNLTIMSFFWFLTRAHYSDVMPHQLEGFKLAERANINNRQIFQVIIIASVIGTLASFGTFLHCFYRDGVRWWFGQETFARLQNWLFYQKPPDHAGIAFFGGGIAISIFLTMMRMRFVWWKLHPAGYAVSSTYQMRENVFCIFASWVAKWAILKYGGIKLHRKSILLFLGFILGEYVVGSVWAIIGIAFKIQTYNFTQWW